MSKRRLFISSVQSEFADARRSIAEYIRQNALLCRYFEPFLFEELPALDISAQRAYLDEASRADVYVLLMGEKYGYEDAEGVSPTEREYDTATAHHAYRIVMLKNVPSRHEKEQRFVEKIEQDVVRDVFADDDELRSNLFASLVEYLTNQGILINGPFDAAVHPTATINDLDFDKIRYFVGMARERRKFPLEYSEENVHQILTSLHLITPNNKLVNAALILFAKDPQAWFPTATVKCAQFYGFRTEKPIPSLQIYDGSIFEVIDKAVAFVMSRIDMRVGERDKTASAVVTPELPTKAVAEAIVNACVHRDYTCNGSVQVMLFRNRLEIWSPGRLPYGVSIESLSGEHESQPVNPVLALPVYYAGYIEQMGTGTTDIVNLCVEQGLPSPAFRQDSCFVTTIYRPEREGDKALKEQLQNSPTDQATDQATDQVTDQVKKLILALRGDAKSVGELMAALELKHRGNLRELYLTPAIEAGILALRYPDVKTHPNQAYFLTDKGLDLLRIFLNKR